MPNDFRRIVSNLSALCRLILAMPYPWEDRRRLADPRRAILAMMDRKCQSRVISGRLLCVDIRLYASFQLHNVLQIGP
jgi:hypothetical protein